MDRYILFRKVLKKEHLKTEWVISESVVLFAFIQQYEVPSIDLVSKNFKNCRNPQFYQTWNDNAMFIRIDLLWFTSPTLCLLEIRQKIVKEMCGLLQD